MTLVVGYADRYIGFMVGDTLLSHRDFRPPDDVGPVNGEFHSLKIQILNGAVAVAFAGEFQEAYQAIRELKAALSEKNEETDPVAWISNRAGLDGCEFLVLLNGQTKRLFRIANGKTLECQRAYIGMQTDYQRYTELRQPYAGAVTRRDGNAEIAVTEGEKEFDVVSNAMEALSRDMVGKKYITVGAISGCIIRVVDARISRQLEYLQAIEVSNFPWEPEGGYTLLASNTETRGVGIYFRSGHRGFMMPVCGEVPCVASHAADLTAFVVEGRGKFGMELVGGKWQTESAKARQLQSSKSQPVVASFFVWGSIYSFCGSLAWLSSIGIYFSSLYLAYLTSFPLLLFSMFIPVLPQLYWIWVLWRTTTTLFNSFTLLCLAWLGLVSIRALARNRMAAWAPPNSN